jgi:hypothetical protein
MKSDFAKAVEQARASFSAMEAAKEAMRVIRVAADDLRKTAPAGVIVKLDGKLIRAHLEEGVELPPEVERLCDIITQDQHGGKIWVYLKYLDNPLPPPCQLDDMPAT